MAPDSFFFLSTFWVERLVTRGGKRGVERSGIWTMFCMLSCVRWDGVIAYFLFSFSLFLWYPCKAGALLALVLPTSVGDSFCCRGLAVRVYVLFSGFQGERTCYVGRYRAFGAAIF